MDLLTSLTWQMEASTLYSSQLDMAALVGFCHFADRQASRKSSASLLVVFTYDIRCFTGILMEPGAALDGFNAFNSNMILELAEQLGVATKKQTTQVGPVEPTCGWPSS